MMPPDMDLQKHFANRRSLAEARAAYLTSARDCEQSLENKREEIARQMIENGDSVGDAAWRRVLCLVRATKGGRRR
jgi:hypothetical protein